jgi:hypothetical protein
MICLFTKGLKFYYFFGMSVGIKRRMIAIGKKYVFTFCKMFENVQVPYPVLFFAFTFKVHRKCKYDPKSLICKKLNFGIKTKNFTHISNTMMPA